MELVIEKSGERTKKGTTKKGTTKKEKSKRVVGESQTGKVQKKPRRVISESQHTEIEDENDTLESCDGDEDFEMPNKD